MSGFEIEIPGFATGQRLTAAALNRLQGYHQQWGHLAIGRLSDGVLYGLEPQANSDRKKLALEPGAFKWQGRTGWLRQPLELPELKPSSEHQRLLLELDFEAPLEEPNHVGIDITRVKVGTRVAYRLVWKEGELEPQALELCRVKYTQGGAFRNPAAESLKTIEDVRRWLTVKYDAGLISMQGVPYAGLGSYPTLHPRLQHGIAQWILVERLESLYFLVPSLLQGMFTICDFTRTGDLGEARHKLADFLESHRHSGILKDITQPSQQSSSKPNVSPVLGG